METFPIRTRIPNAAYLLPKRATRDLGHLPGPRANWLTGDLSRFARDDAQYVATEAETHGNVFVLPGPLGTRTVVMLGPEANRRLLSRPEETISNHLAYVQAGLFGDSIVTRDFEDHAQLRKVIAGTFGKPALREHLESMNRLVTEHLSVDRIVPGEALDLFPVVKRLALKIAARIFAGIDLGDEQARMESSLAALLKMVSVRLPVRIPGGVYDRGVRGRAFAAQYFASQVDARRSGKEGDLFSLLCRAENDEGERLAESEIVDNVIGAMVAGHDTTTVAVSALAFELARHPDWQQTIREDCRGALADSRSGVLSLEAAGTLDRVEACAKEVLRLYSPIRYVGRRVVREFEFEGKRIPENTSILLSVHHTHHNPEYFDSPETFRPERFNVGGAGARLNPDAWAPFGKGPHVCLGMGFAMLEIKAFICALVTQYQLSLPHPYTLRVDGLPVSMPRGGVPIQLTRI